MFALTDLTVSFGRHQALKVDSLALKAGQLVAVMGPNGSGKTTLLHVLASLQSPTTGTCERSPETQIAWVAQNHDHRHWMPLATHEVLAMSRYGHRGLLGRLTKSDRAAIESAAARLEVTDLAHRRFGDLSGGQRQRVLIAMAVAQRASCLLLDEPITGLDLVSQQVILDVMSTERDAGRLVVVTTHHLEEARQCDRVILLNQHVVADGTPHDVLAPEPLGEAFGRRLLRDDVCEIPDHVHHPLLLDDHGHGHHEHQPS